MFEFDRLDVSGNLNLRYLDCMDVSCERLDLSRHEALHYLFIRDCRIPEIEVGQSSALNHVYLARADCTHFDLSGCPNLSSINITEVPLTELKLPAAVHSVQLKRLDIERLEVTGIVGDADHLTSFGISDCGQLKRLDFTSGLRSISCKDCPALSVLNLGDCRELQSFTCSGTALSSLDLSQRGDFRFATIDCSGNRLTTLVLPSVLYSLVCQGNLLEELDISGCDLSNLKWRPMETLQRIRLRRDQERLLGDSDGVERIYID